MKIFLSYSRTNKDIARRLVDALAPYYDIWVDWEDIKAGEQWRTSIARGIHRCHVFIFLASEDSLESEYCKWEIHIAQRWRKIIIPVVTCEGLHMEKELAKLQWVFLDEEDEKSSDKAVRSLINAVRPRPSPHWVYIALTEAIIIAILVLAR